MLKLALSVTTRIGINFLTYVPKQNTSMDSNSDKPQHQRKFYRTDEEFLKALNLRLARYGITATGAQEGNKATNEAKGSTYEVRFFPGKDDK